MLDVRFSRGKLRRDAPNSEIHSLCEKFRADTGTEQVYFTPRWSPPLSLNGNPIYNDRCYCSWKRVDQPRRRISQSSSGRRVPVDLFPRKLTDWMVPTWTIDLARLKRANMVGEMFAEVSISFLMFAKLREMRYFEYFASSKHRIEADKTKKKLRKRGKLIVIKLLLGSRFQTLRQRREESFTIFFPREKNTS